VGFLKCMRLEQVLDCIRKLPVFQVPPGSPAMQFPYARVADCLPQTGEQEFGKQWVVAVPLPVRVQRDKKNVRLFKLPQHLMTIRVPRQRVAQRASQPVKYRGLLQKSPYTFRLLLDHFIG
jgi:hypothetical protein